MLREQDKHFLASLYAAAIMIFLWKGLWDMLYLIPILGEMKGAGFVFLFLGFAILIFSGMIFSEFDPLNTLQKATTRTLQKIQKHPEKRLFLIKYLDKEKKKEMQIAGTDIHKVERGTLIVRHPTEKKELFIPLHRVTEVLYKGQRYWRF